ncbi:hypothetical protein MRB53_037784 [Persea americana]|nr:hypothetical protein MRB53_037784 [Persea americana]
MTEPPPQTHLQPQHTSSPAANWNPFTQPPPVPQIPQNIEASFAGLQVSQPTYSAPSPVQPLQYQNTATNPWMNQQQQQIQPQQQLQHAATFPQSNVYSPAPATNPFLTQSAQATTGANPWSQQLSPTTNALHNNPFGLPEPEQNQIQPQNMVSSSSPFQPAFSAHQATVGAPEHCNVQSLQQCHTTTSYHLCQHNKLVIHISNT